MAIRHLARLALWIAATVAVGYALATVPNIELVTASIFLAGVLFGPWTGGLVGLVSEFLYSLTSPFGIAAPPLLVAQLLGMAIAGVLGGLVSRWIISYRTPLAVHVVCGLLGFILTVIFDVLTTASFLVFSGVSLEKLLVSLVFGLGFYLAHVGWNTIVFATLIPPLAAQLRKSVAASSQAK